MKALLVARKSLLEMLREWQLLLLVILLPLAFLAITAFGYSAPLSVTHPILIMSPDPQAEPLIGEIEALRYADGRSMFEVTRTTNSEAAQVALKEQEATAVLVISPSEGLVTIRGDALYGRFYRASTILESLIAQYADRLAGRPELVRIVEQPAFGAGPQTEFDLYAPGMIIFALLLIIPQTAMLAAREIRWGTLRRLRLACLHARDLFAGLSLSQMVVAVAQVVVVLVGALLLGFNNQGSLLLAIVVGLAVCLSAIGLGLVVACFVENDSQALNIGATVSMFQVLFSGAFYQLPPLTVFTLAGHQIDLFDIFPATHGFLALQQVLTYGANFAEIAFRLGATLVLSAVYLALGVWLFQRLKMRRDV